MGSVYGRLLRLMLAEEVRFQIAFTSRFNLLIMPLLTFAMAFLFGVSLERVAGEIPLETLMRGAAVSMIGFGGAMGAFTFLGREFLEHRMGLLNMLMHTPETLPLDTRAVLLCGFAKEVGYYLASTLAPLCLGAAASTPWNPYSPADALAMGLLALSFFLLGSGSAFLVAAVYSRSKPLSFVTGALVASGLAALFALEIRLGWTLTGSGGRVGLSLIPFSAAATIGSLFIYRMGAEGRSRAYAPLLPRMIRRATGTQRCLMGKELVDLWRGGVISKVAVSYMVPTLILSLFAYAAERAVDLPLSFSTVFYGVMLGFFGLTTYSWLNNLETPEYLDTLPVTVPQVIRSKLYTFLLIAGPVCVGLLVAIALWRDEVGLLVYALPVTLGNLFYVGAATAYLTGLRTNAMIFDPPVMVQFVLVSMVPLALVTVLSQLFDAGMAEAGWLLVGSGVVFGLIGFLMSRAVDFKWRHAGFSMAG